jgi:hypothetical protein
MAVGVVVAQAVAQPQHLAGAQGLGQRRLGGLLGPAGIAVGVQQALAGGQQRAQAVVLQRAALEDEVVAGPGPRRRPAIWSATVVIALQLVLAAPAVEAEAGGPPTLPRRSGRCRAARCRRTGRGRPRPGDVASRRGRRPRPRRRRPSAGRARARSGQGADQGRRPRPAPSRLSSHSSAWLGQPTHIARCGDHSAGTRGVLMRRGKWPWLEVASSVAQTKRGGLIAQAAPPV